MAVLVTVNKLNTAMTRSDCGGSTGAVFTAVTNTLKLLVALSGGTLSSVTIVVKI